MKGSLPAEGGLGIEGKKECIVFAGSDKQGARGTGAGVRGAIGNKGWER